MANILITGAAGFIGHHLVEHTIKTTRHDVTIIDRLTYASSGFNRLRDIGAYENRRIKIFTHDFSQPIDESLLEELGEPDFIIHMGAETHVEQSIQNPRKFVQANVVGTMEMLEFAKTIKGLKKFLYFSTDEVFGPAPKGVSYKEWDRYDCTNPYSASKAGGEELCLAYANTYRIPLLITHTMNVYGERQHKEKFIPIIMNKVRKGETLEIHCTKGEPASRSWIHARNASSAIMFLLETDLTLRDKYNITGEVEYDNLSLAKLIAEIMGKPLNYKLVDYYENRPGHDARYMLDGTKIREAGWIMPIDFERSLKKTIEWTLDHPHWLEWK